jgi:hypothetical protein
MQLSFTFLIPLQVLEQRFRGASFKFWYVRFEVVDDENNLLFAKKKFLLKFVFYGELVAQQFIRRVPVTLLIY